MSFFQYIANLLIVKKYFCLYVSGWRSQQLWDPFLVYVSASPVITRLYVFLRHLVQVLSCFHIQWWPDHTDTLWDSSFYSIFLDSMRDYLATGTWQQECIGFPRTAKLKWTCQSDCFPPSSNLQKAYGLPCTVTSKKLSGFNPLSTSQSLIGKLYLQLKCSQERNNSLFAENPNKLTQKTCMV